MFLLCEKFDLLYLILYKNTVRNIRTNLNFKLNIHPHPTMPTNRTFPVIQPFKDLSDLERYLDRHLDYALKALDQYGCSAALVLIKSSRYTWSADIPPFWVTEDPGVQHFDETTTPWPDAAHAYIQIITSTKNTPTKPKTPGSAVSDYLSGWTVAVVGPDNEPLCRYLANTILGVLVCHSAHIVT